MAELTDIRETVRARYARAAAAAARGAYGGARALEAETGCCGPGSGDTPTAGGVAFGGVLYGDEEAAGTPAAAVAASLGCGVPTAVADLHEGEIVLDLGSGAGADVLISARRVGPTGRAIGLDMTDEMLALARVNAARAGVENVEFVKGYLEQLPLADASVDVVISNCVINLSGDKARVIREAARVLRPGGRLAVSDVIADAAMDEATRADMAAWTGCVAGALTDPEFRAALEAAGFTDVDIRETHRVHEHAASAIIRARKPAPSACCDSTALATCCDPGAKDDCCGSAAPPASCACSPATPEPQPEVLGTAGSPACALPAAELAPRVALITAFGRESLADREVGAERAVLRFRAADATRSGLTAIVAAEAECCGFLSLDLRDDGDAITLTIEAPPGGEPVMRPLVAAFATGSADRHSTPRQPGAP